MSFARLPLRNPLTCLFRIYAGPPDARRARGGAFILAAPIVFGFAVIALVG